MGRISGDQVNGLLGGGTEDRQGVEVEPQFVLDDVAAEAEAAFQARIGRSLAAVRVVELAQGGLGDRAGR